MWRSCSPRIAGPSSNGRTPDFGSGNGGSSPPGPILTKKKRAGWPDPRPRCVLPASTLRLGLVGLLLLRLLDLAIGRTLGLLRIGLGQAEAVERLADAVAARQAVEDGLGRDSGVLGAEVLGEHVCGDELAARQLRVGRVGRLERVLERLGR